jgi:hypothetical protein
MTVNTSRNNRSVAAGRAHERGAHGHAPRSPRGLHAAALAVAGALSSHCSRGARIFNVPLFDIALQAIVQGVLTAIVALLLYVRMVRFLGST